jgi:hypothetical protein
LRLIEPGDGFNANDAGVDEGDSFADGLLFEGLERLFLGGRERGQREKNADGQREGIGEIGHWLSVVGFGLMEG